MSDIQKYLDMMNDIYSVSTKLGMKSFVWAGLLWIFEQGMFCRCTRLPSRILSLNHFHM